MRRISYILVGLLMSLATGALAQNGKVVVLNLDTPVFNSTADYIAHGIKKAEEVEADLIILKINTPGGLLASTRQIAGSIMESKVPILSYVTPAGAHAGSAGAFIALAADMSAMSPGTNIGASHPVSALGAIDSIMNDKITEDAAAFIRSIAEERDRDPDLLMQMVSNSRSYSAQEALDKEIVDFIALTVNDLLDQLDSSPLNIATESGKRAKFRDAELMSLEMATKDRFMNRLNDPNIMYLLLMLGIMGILFEVFNPGAIFPGVIGVISLILAGYGMSLLPVDYTGLSLIILGIILFILEIKFQSYGLLSLGGVISLFLGSIFLIKTEPSFDVVDISWTVLISSVVVTAAFFIFLLGVGVRALKGETTTGSTGMIGKRARVITDLEPNGKVRVMGEIWDAESKSGTIVAGDDVEIIKIDNLKLIVKSIDNQ